MATVMGNDNDTVFSKRTQLAIDFGIVAGGGAIALIGSVPALVVGGAVALYGVANGVKDTFAIIDEKPSPGR